jgi:hypothetical protein
MSRRIAVLIAPILLYLGTPAQEPAPQSATHPAVLSPATPEPYTDSIRILCLY